MSTDSKRGNNKRHEPIAVVGVSALFPGSADANGFWRDILAGRDLISDVPAHHWLIEDYYDSDPKAPDKTYAKRGSFLSPVDFDPMAFGIPPTIVEATDTSQLLALIVARQVLDDASQGQFEKLDKSNISVILGVTSAQELLGTMVSRLQRPVWTKALREGGVPEEQVQELCDRIADHYVPWQESSFPGLLGNVVAGRIANRFDLGGTNCVTDAACASTFAAVSMAVNELRLGDSEMVIAGGVDTLNDIFMYMCFSKTPALSPTGDCRPFSDQADGTLLGEGMSMVALKRLSDAERDGDRIYAVLKGVGTSSDGRAKSVYAPVSEGQARALHRAYGQAGYGPESVELLEAHGTATKAGDVAEFNGLRLAFEASERAGNQWCALGSVKSQIGHTKAAAGAAGLFKVVMALHHKTLPPTIKVDQPNPNLHVDESPFYLNTEARPWIRAPQTHPRRGSVSSFGFGGSNFHVAVEEYRGSGDVPGRLRTFPEELVLLTADTPDALTTVCERMAEDATGDGYLSWLAATTQKAYTGQESCRLAIVAGDEAGLRSRLQMAIPKVRANESFAAPNGVYYNNGKADGSVAFLFPGQGSQYVGMGGDLAMAFDAAREVWDRTAALTFNGGGTHLHEMVFPRPVFSDEERQRQKEALTETQWAQPAIGATSVSQLALLHAIGVEAACVGGHSYGEVVALHAAGVLDEASMLLVSRKRGEVMYQASAIPGAMTAVSCDLGDLKPLLSEWKEDVVVANHNSPEQVVLSGTVEAIDAVEKRLAGEDMNFRRLPVSTAFHSPLMAEAEKPFEAFLQDVKFKTPSIDVYSNAKAAPYPKKGAEIRKRLAHQIDQPVLFVEQIEAMYERGVRTFIEVGPRSVLTGLVGKCLGDRPHRAVCLDRKGRHGLTSLWHALGQLAADGVSMDLTALGNGYEEPADPRAATKPKMTLAITGSNYGKVYPPPGGAAELPLPNPPRPPEERIVEVIKEVPVEVIREVPVPVASSQQQASMQQPVQYLQQPVQPAGNQQWLLAYQETQRQTVDAFTAFQRSMTESQGSFFKAMEASYTGLGQLAGVQQAPVMQQPVMQPQPVMQQPVMQPQPVMQQPVLQQPAPTPPPAAPQIVAAPVAAPVATPPPPQPRPAPEPQPAPSVAPSVDLQALMLDVVAEKTGYPVEMLDLSMDMEADLGIDSIKRVEILSGMREKAPGLPEVDTGKMAALKTLAEIVEYMQESAPELTASAPAAASAPSPAPAAPGVDLQALMLDVVAEKTGYPSDMLSLDMDMEADLGIDSIKRVEILSGMREKAPGLPEVDTGKMAALKTLAEIVEYMQESAPELTASAPAATPAAAPAAPGVDLQALMLDVVAEKTGYPSDMLSLDMDMEADLGIDSIKRVEILSGMREKAPGLPEVDTGKMAALKTLAQIVLYMSESSMRDAGVDDGSGSGSADATPVEAPAAAPTMGRFVLREVDAPASGLAMPGLAGAKVAVINTGVAKIADALVDELGQRGMDAVAVRDVPDDATAVVFLGGLRNVKNEDEAVAVNRRAFAVARDVAPRLTEGKGLFVTVQDLGGDFGLGGNFKAPRAALGGLAGLVKTAAQEWPNAAVKAIDIERGKRSAKNIAEALADELWGGGAEVEVGLHADGRRTTLESVRRDVEGDVNTTSSKHCVGKDSVIVASGGGRGVTAATLIALAQETKARFVVLGRTALADEPASCNGVADSDLQKAMLADAKASGEKLTPKELGGRVSKILAAREVRGTLQALADAGSEARYVAADVQDAKALATELTAVRKAWGPITGIVHGAGVIADKVIAEKTNEQFDRVFDTKVVGLRALLDVTAKDPLSMICLFSSVTARCGNVGQSDYAMANEVLNKIAIAERVRRGDCVVKSLNWGPWESGMVTPGLKVHFEAQGVPLIPLDTGARMLVDELLKADSAEIELVLGGEPTRGPLLGGDVQGTVIMDAMISEKTHPYLEGHRIAGMPVFPVVLALEWFSRLAAIHCPGHAVTSIRDFRVLNGIRLENFYERGDVFELESRQVSNGTGRELEMQLRSKDGRPRYKAVVTMSPESPGVSQKAPKVSPNGLKALEPWPEKSIYGDVLFHGPEFQVIENLEGISKEGMSAVLQGVAAKGWKDTFRTDPALLDGGLQLAVLWFKRELGGASLPMAIGNYKQYGAPPSGPVNAVLRSRVEDSDRIVADLTFSDDDGTVLAELEGVQIYRRPDVDLAS